MKAKAYGYLRVSGKGQLEGHGLDRQQETIEGYAKKAGYEIAEWFREEGVSGTSDEGDRPAFQAMVAAILKDGVRTVIVEGLDRLAREYRIQETLMIYLASKEINLIVARTEENVTEAVQADPMRKALVQIQGIFSELEKSLLVKKLRNAREKVKLEKGKCEGAKGYNEVNPDLVKEIRKLRRTPKDGTRRKTNKEIAAILNDRGEKTRKRKEFTGQIIASILCRCKGG
ncbi:MAG: resolvase [Deltaproteobacteria bacterium HGW-Deltaproteobacteria-15]|jgi:DNA invertase Pin-like site-specific DNA recombinase|nr:MAG: resolvase [Deltaproteobacteria bacterium HGW-Deltaproteobacteria-15]